MIFEQGVYRIDFDPKRTAEFYAQDPRILCDCAGCRNFAAAVSQLPQALGSFLAQFGIDPAKPAEMSAVYAPDKDRIFYDGFYHLCGNLITGTRPFVQTGPKNFKLDEAYLLPVGDDTLWIRSDCALVDPAFPRPVLQVEVNFQLPWVLEEANPYL